MKDFGNIDELFAHDKEEGTLLVLSGLIKESENAGTVLYAPLNCDNWIEIEKNSISKSVYLGNLPCKKPGEEPHTHPFVTLHVSAERVQNLDYLRVIAALNSQLAKLDKTRQKRQAPNMLLTGRCNADGSALGWTACGGTVSCNGQLITADPDQRVFWNHETCWVESCPECD